jgi:hypothetical protein
MTLTAPTPRAPSTAAEGARVVGLRGTMFHLGRSRFDCLVYIVVTKSIFKIDDGNIVLS